MTRRVSHCRGLTELALLAAGMAGGRAPLWAQGAAARTGTLLVAGLQWPVQVLRDSWGVPLIVKDWRPAVEGITELRLILTPSRP